MLYAFLFLQNPTLCRTQWVHEKQVCVALVIAQLLRHVSPIKVAECFSRSKLHNELFSCQFLGGTDSEYNNICVNRSCILAWHRRQHVVASECPLLHACKGAARPCSLITSEQRSSFPRVVTTTPGEVSVLTLSLRRLNSSVLLPSSRRNWSQFRGIFLLPSTLIRTPAPLFILVAALRLAFLYSSNTTSTRWTDFTNWLADSDCWYKCVTFRYFCHFLARPGGKIKDFFALCHKLQCRDAGKVICLSHERIPVHLLLLDHGRYYPLLMLWIHQCLV